MKPSQMKPSSSNCYLTLSLAMVIHVCPATFRMSSGQHAHGLPRRGVSGEPFHYLETNLRYFFLLSIYLFLSKTKILSTNRYYFYNVMLARPLPSLFTFWEIVTAFIYCGDAKDTASFPYL